MQRNQYKLLVVPAAYSTVSLSRSQSCFTLDRGQGLGVPPSCYADAGDVTPVMPRGPAGWEQFMTHARPHY